MVNAVLDNDTRNIERWRYRQALEDTGRFVEAHMAQVPSQRDGAALLRHAVSHLENEEG